MKEGLKGADRSFWNTFDCLADGREERVWITLDTSFTERAGIYSLWGLLVNAGYLTVTKWVNTKTCVVKIPNNEVMSEFQILITELSGIDGLDLQRLFECLLNREMDGFFALYREIVISCTSYKDIKSILRR